LFLLKDHKKVKIKSGLAIGVVTATDTFNYQDTSPRWTLDSIGLNSLTIKSPDSVKIIDYKSILTIQYARRDNTTPCIYCFLAPIFVILAPIVSWKDGEFQPGTFIPLMTIGIVPPTLAILSIKRNRIITYKLEEWTLLTK